MGCLSPIFPSTTCDTAGQLGSAGAIGGARSPLGKAYPVISAQQIPDSNCLINCGSCDPVPTELYGSGEAVRSSSTRQFGDSLVTLRNLEFLNFRITC